MGIRGRLLVLAVGAAVPLALLGLFDLYRVWTTSREQLNKSVEQQAELAALAFERWVDAQQQPLITLAATGAAEAQLRSTELQESLRVAMTPRPHWIDVRILDTSGATIVTQPPDAESLPDALIEKLMSEIRDDPLSAIETDWTRGVEHRVLAVAVPVERGGAVIARIRAEALDDLFRGIKLPSGAVLTILDAQGRIVYRSPSMETYLGADISNSTLLAALAPERTASMELASPIDGTHRVYGLARAGTTGFITMVGVPSASLHEPARRQLARYLLLSVVGLLCASVAALFIARGVARPLRRLRRDAQRFGAGDFSTRTEVKGGGDEIAQLGATFNTMAAQIKEREARLTELDQLKSEFVSGVSHELRTPLTTIKTLTHLMLRDGHITPSQRKHLETISAQCNRQIDLVLNLLDLSRIESGALSLESARVDAGEVVRSCLQIERPAAELRGHAIQANLPSELPPVLADRSALRRVLCSLVENAIKFTPDGGRITLGARAMDDTIAISVTDTGRGIGPQDIPHVFEKFYRGNPDEVTNGGHSPEDEQSKDGADADVPGIGLGLYLAHNIIAELGGRISVESASERGSTFTVHLPVYRSDSIENEISGHANHDSKVAHS